MQKGKWTLNFTIQINGETSVGDPVDITRNIKIELLATNEQEAEKQAGMVIKEIKEKSRIYDINFFKKYVSAVEDEDSIECKDFFLNFNYKKTLEVKSPVAKFF